MLDRLLRALFVLCVVRPVVFILLGVNLRNRDKLPKRGPAILIANHNSHLDTAILVSVFPLSDLHYVHPVAAADYWLKNPFISWFALKIAGIIPIARKKDVNNPSADPFEGISAALKQDQIIIYYPEGTRGEPERMTQFKSGISRLAERHPEVPIVPMFMHGTGKALPRGEGLLIPFCCNIYVGDPIQWNGDRDRFLAMLEGKVHELAKEAKFPAWE